MKQFILARDEQFILRKQLRSHFESSVLVHGTCVCVCIRFYPVTSSLLSLTSFDLKKVELSHGEEFEK